MTRAASTSPPALRRASRLDAFIRRIAAQRTCLNHATGLIGDRPGIVIELGLGNGRTFDHLREHYPGREIYVFDREIAAHPACIPDEAHTRLGDFRDTLPAFRLEGRPKAVLIHADFGSPNRDRDAELALWLGPALQPLLAAGGIVATDRALPAADLTALDLPEGVAAGDYFLYRAD